MDLKAFFYLLLRDELPFGKVERIMTDIRAAAGRKPVLEDANLDGYAASLAKDFLKDDQEEIKRLRAECQELRQTIQDLSRTPDSL